MVITIIIVVVIESFSTVKYVFGNKGIQENDYSKKFRANQWPFEFGRRARAHQAVSRHSDLYAATLSVIASAITSHACKQCQTQGQASG